MIEINLEDYDQISKEVVRLAHELESESETLALAELLEDKVAVEFLKGEVKTTVALAEKEALVSTENRYHELKYKREAKIELLNAYKKRIEVLSWGFKTANT